MNKKLKQTLLPLIAAMIWGTAFVAQDVCSDRIPSMAFNALRFFIAVVFLLAMRFIIRAVRRKRGVLPVLSADEKKSYRKRLAVAALATGTAVAAASVLQQAGLQYGTDSGKAGFITALYVVLVPIVGLFLKKRVRPIFWLAVALATVGLYLLCMNGSFALALGDLLTLLCAVAFTGQILLVDRFSPGLDSVDLVCAQFTVAGIWSLIGMLIFEKPDMAGISACMLPLLYVAVFSSGVAYLLQAVAQRDGDPSVVSLLFSMEAVFCAVASAIILHQRMTVREYVGCALMFAAVVLSQLTGEKAPAAAE